MTKKQERLIKEKSLQTYGDLMMNLFKDRNKELEKELNKNPFFFVCYYKGETIYCSLDGNSFESILRDLDTNILKKTLYKQYLLNDLFCIVKGNDMNDLEYNFFAESSTLDNVRKIHNIIFN